MGGNLLVDCMGDLPKLPIFRQSWTDGPGSFRESNAIDPAQSYRFDHFVEFGSHQLASYHANAFFLE